MRGAQHEQARGVEVDRHVGEVRLDERLLGERLAELHAPRDEADRLVERAPRHADRRGADRDAERIERLHRELHALPRPRRSARVAGTTTPRSSSAPIGCGAVAVIGLTVTPGASSGTQNAVSPARRAPGSVDANTIAWSAMPRFEMNSLSPSSR